MLLLHSVMTLQLTLTVATVSCSVVHPLESIGETLRQCLVSQVGGGLGQCLGVGAISKLQSLDADPEFDLVDGVTLTRDGQEYREAHNFADADPSSFRTIVDSFSHVFSRRNMQWDMGFLYPGLAMRVSPSVIPGGTLEFVLDQRREAVNVHSLKEAGTGKYPEGAYGDSLYRGMPEQESDQLNVYPNIAKSLDTSSVKDVKTRGRNFAWDEKEQKINEAPS
ncbi:unnamed protein product [Phaedon cochleariae]|uniref:Uncharacterized protein n=1 Tax=Phaedon cochleariae TaxID=80249 RepID=A0A9N9X482_PHACE|nr:unnamed protein product [Phaedon cochleariae]